MAFASYAYRFVTKRFSTLFVALTVGAISLDLIVDKGGDYLFDQVILLTIYQLCVENLGRERVCTCNKIYKTPQLL